MNLPDDKDIINLIKQRDEFRIKKDFKSADEVRDKLLDMGVELQRFRWQNNLEVF